MATAGTAIARIRRGLGAALRSRPGMFAGVAAAVVALDLAAPVVLLSIARKPVDFFSFNPWLRRLPDYLLSSEPLAAKLAFLSRLKIAWASAEGSDGIDWGFVVDVPTLARVAFTALLFGAFFASWAHWRAARAARGPSGAGRAGVLGAATSVLGITTGPCTLAGCGAPVLPVVGLAFAGLPAGALAVFAVISRAGAALVLALMAAALAWLAWQSGADRAQCEAASSSV